jgi:hypothetical protein
VATDEFGESLQLSLPSGLIFRPDEDEADASKRHEVRAPPPRSAGRRRLSIPIGAAVAITGLALFFGLRMKEKGGPPVVAAQPIEAPPLASDPAQVQNGPVQNGSERFSLTVRASPPSAQVTIDGKPAGNPSLAFYPKDGSAHRVVARAWGYEPKATDVTITGDMVVDLGLDRRVSTTGAVLASAGLQGAPKRAAGEAPLPSEVAAKSVSVYVRQDVASARRAPVHPIETKDPYGAP